MDSNDVLALTEPVGARDDMVSGAVARQNFFLPSAPHTQTIPRFFRSAPGVMHVTDWPRAFNVAYQMVPTFVFAQTTDTFDFLATRPALVQVVPATTIALRAGDDSSLPHETINDASAVATTPVRKVRLIRPTWTTFD